MFLPSLLRNPLLAAATALALASPSARADGLADLKAALARLQGNAPLKGSYEMNLWRRQGEGAEAEEAQAQVSVGLDDGARGLQVLYGRDLLARIDAEQRAGVRDTRAKTPTLDAVGELRIESLKGVVAAAPALARALESAQFKSETAQLWNGKPARLLSFEMPLDKLPERQRRYVKKFDVAFDIWIAADGTPLASRMRQNVSGRAFVVVSFKAANDENRSYGVVGDRLVVLRHEFHGQSSGAGEKDERKLTTSFSPQP